MPEFTLRNYHKGDIERLADFLRVYRAAYPDAKLFSAGFYTHHPGLANERNVFCMLDEDQRMVGFAPLFPAAEEEEPREDKPDILTLLLASPGLEQASQVRERLLTAMIKRANEMKTAWGQSRVLLAADMMVCQVEDVDFLKDNGFAPFDQILVMRRDAQAPVPAAPPPTGVEICPETLAQHAARRAYLGMYNRCFPEYPKTEQDLQFLLASPLWATGRVFTAQAGGKRAGSVRVYRDESGVFGVLDDVMVLPEWRGRGIARSLVAEGLRFLQQNGAPPVILEVRERNTPAIAVYTAFGFRVTNREVLLSRWV